MIDLPGAATTGRAALAGERPPVATPADAVGGMRGAVRDVLRVAGVATARWRPLPELVLVGVKRGGTTYFFRLLEAHPQVVALYPSARWTPMRANTKSPKFFDREYERGVRWYRSHFPTTFARRLRTGSVGAPAIACDAGSGYLHHPAGPERLARVLPASQFVVLLRDPVERALSHWKLNLLDGVEPLADVAAALDAEPARRALAERVAQGDPRRAAWLVDTYSYVGHGDYATDLRRLFEAVGRDRVHVICAEELFATPEAALAPLLRATGLVPFAVPPIGRQNESRSADIPSEVRERLAEVFERSYTDLRALTGREYPWPGMRGGAA